MLYFQSKSSEIAPFSFHIIYLATCLHLLLFTPKKYSKLLVIKKMDWVELASMTAKTISEIKNVRSNIGRFIFKDQKFLSQDHLFMSGIPTLGSGTYDALCAEMWGM
jgi:hypothetical protein